MLNNGTGRSKTWYNVGYGDIVMPMYEAAIYNKDVRAIRAEGKSHPSISDDWANVRFIEVEAMNEAMARAKLARDFPESDGFVIDELNTE